MGEQVEGVEDHMPNLLAHLLFWFCKLFECLQWKGLQLEEKASFLAMIPPNQELEDNHHETGSELRYKILKNHGAIDNYLKTQLGFYQRNHSHMQQFTINVIHNA